MYIPKNILVTGGCGFIASHLINYLGTTYDCNIINIDKMGYCSNPDNIILKNNYVFQQGNINDTNLVSSSLESYEIDTVFHLAAESHVDRSFDDPLYFTTENVLGTHNLLECCKKYGKVRRFIHMSTDEVYGETLNHSVNEESSLSPTNPYSASKAAVEMIMNPYKVAYDLPIITVRCNNIYGPNQYEEKVIPKFVKNLVLKNKCFIQGDGYQSRSFLYVDDAVKALDLIMNSGQIHEIYNIGTVQEVKIIDLAKKIIAILGTGKIKYMEDRKFNDKCYFIDCKKLRALGWKQQTDFDTGLKKTVESILKSL